MWLIAKAIFTLMALGVRLFNKYSVLRQGSGDSTAVGGQTIYTSTGKSKSGLPAKTTFFVQIKLKSVFKLTRETSLDRWFKAIGFAVELQTGDNRFDESIYISSDCQAFAQELKRDEVTRKVILGLFDGGCKSISYDGRNLKLEFLGDCRGKTSILEPIAKLAVQISDTDRHLRGDFSDPFVWKMVVIESAIWALAGYAFSGFLEYQFTSRDVYLETWPLVVRGLAVGGFGGLLLLLIVGMLMRGSSRGHRIVVESFFALILSFPVGGIELVSDLNRELDKSEPLMVSRTVQHLEQRRHRGRRGRVYYTYHVHFDANESN